ncbi:LysM peptidoglycan-binding domain-containing protein [Desmospora profundinema]|uniref:Stage VI sporulation protein D n=1 Tax=Desmospora profundinema TaxID=1571184 RepID=A0ABU1INT0_9BACL|nr:LysM peptidoglycan-binding domain-containing protein [Desmospora profundinema]MDR6226440.1 hypothetical protein [Desmospora profundinema]
MTGSKVNQLRFDISEKVRLHPQQPGIGTLLELDLYPDVEVEDQETHLKIQGYLRLNGTYHPEQGVDAETDGGGQETEAEASAQQEEIAYVIPVEITLPAERVDMDQIASEIHSFDYQVLSPFELQIEALLIIDGFIQEEENEEEGEPVEVVSSQAAAFSVPPNGDIRWKQDVPGDTKGEQDEYEFVHVARLEEGEEGAEVKADQEDTKAEVEAEEESAPVEAEKIQAELETEESEERRSESEPEKGEEPSVSPVTFHPFQPERDREESPLSRQQPLRMPHIGEFDFQHLEEDERTRFGIERMFEEKDLSSEQPEPVDDTAELDADPPEEEKNKGSSQEWAQWILGEEQEQFVKLRMVIVHKQDSIDSLSERYQVPASKIVHLNRLESEVLEEGQIVYIPSS